MANSQHAFRITKGRPDDKQAVLALYAKVVEAMHQHGFMHWHTGYPTPDTVAHDLAHGWMYLLKEGEEIAGTIVINAKQDEEYKQVEWRGGNYAVVHRLAIRPDFWRKGLAQIMMNFAEDHITLEGYESIRLDTVSNFERGLQLYDRLGYKRRGIVHLEWANLDVMCYEKLL